MESQKDYLQRRADEEAIAAECAASEKARALHQELANRYRSAANEEREKATAELAGAVRPGPH